MIRLAIMLSVMVLLFSTGFRPMATYGQHASLEDVLPSAEDVGPGMAIIEEQARTLEDLAQTFADPAEAERRLREWGWEANVVRSFAAADGSSGSTTPLEVSLHQFGSDDGAATALPYFASSRADALTLAPTDVPLLGHEIRAISGRVGGGVKVSIYLRVDDVVARITTLGPTPAAARSPSSANVAPFPEAVVPLRGMRHWSKSLNDAAPSGRSDEFSAVGRFYG